MKTENYVIAIDPDCIKSGVCFLNKAEKSVVTACLSFPCLVDYLIRKRAEYKSDIAVVVEAGWLNQSIWHMTYRDTRGTAAAKGHQVGRNHETGRKIVEMAQHYKFPTTEFRPLKKFWRGTDGKITHEELLAWLNAHGCNAVPRGNQDVRDAVLIAMAYANLPQIRPFKIPK